MNRQRIMMADDLRNLTEFFKALSDAKRLKLIRLLAERRYSVGELAGQLDLTEPTTSHHLQKLRKLGLVNLEAVGNSRFYWLNQENLDRMRGYVNQIEHIDLDAFNEEYDNSWIDALQIEDWEQKIMKDYFVGRRLRKIPRKQLKMLVILNYLASQFEPNRIYTEPDVNEIIKQTYDDFAALRRELVDFRYLGREKNGKTYWLLDDSDEHDD